MALFDFTTEGEGIRHKVSSTLLSDFAVPHLVVENIFSDDLVAQINENWPDEDGFRPEVPGMKILSVLRRNYGNFSKRMLDFWKHFNEVVWLDVVSATAAAFTAPAAEVFGELYYKHLCFDQPLTLMQANPNYPGHSMHHHFYHAPHWAFTMLLYIDPEDKYSNGTSLNRLLPRDKFDNEQTSYQTRDLDWRTDVAMDSFHWQDQKFPDRVFGDRQIDYKFNRLLSFLDGPLALHSVKFDNPDHSPNPMRARDGGRYARRRILRSHVKVHQVPFYRKHSALSSKPIDPANFKRIMAPNAILSADDQRYFDQILRPFFRERLGAYARAAHLNQCQKPDGQRKSAADRTSGYSSCSDDRFKKQFVTRIP